MEINEFIEKLKIFFKGSNTFGGITFNGCYGMSSDKFLLALEHFFETGDNVLDEHSEIVYLSWDANKDDIYYNEQQRMDISNILENKGFWNIHYFLNAEEIEHIKYLLSKSISTDSWRETYQFRRRQACIYTSDPKVRSRIFARDGKVCKKCGATTNLHLDHIIPVSKGGLDEDDNLQVLCISCNSSKNNKLPED